MKGRSYACFRVKVRQTFTPACDCDAVTHVRVKIGYWLLAISYWPPNSPPNPISSLKPILKVDSAIEGGGISLKITVIPERIM
jgi:hypothetical protein